MIEEEKVLDDNHQEQELTEILSEEVPIADIVVKKTILYRITDMLKELFS